MEVYWRAYIYFCFFVPSAKLYPVLHVKAGAQPPLGNNLFMASNPWDTLNQPCQVRRRNNSYALLYHCDPETKGDLQSSRNHQYSLKTQKNGDVKFVVPNKHAWNRLTVWYYCMCLIAGGKLGLGSPQVIWRSLSFGLGINQRRQIQHGRFLQFGAFCIVFSPLESYEKRL